MVTRNDAVNAREGMESYKSGDMQLRVSHANDPNLLFHVSYLTNVL